MNTNLTPRIIAGVLAAGGIGWGLLLLAFNLSSPLVPQFFLGYLVTAWYVVRVFRTSSLAFRRVMWVVSLVTHGGWLAVTAFSSGAFAQPLFVIWWVGASVLSVVGLLTERRSAKTADGSHAAVETCRT